MVDPALFRTGSFAYGTTMAGLLMLGQTTTFVVLALALQTHLNASALDTGLVGLPHALAAAACSAWVGRHVIAHGRTLIALALAGLVAGTLGCIAVARGIEAGASWWWLAVPLVLNGAGMGICIPPNQMLTLHDVPTRRAGSAAGAKFTVERIATAIGTATITGVYFAAGAAGGGLAGFEAGCAVISVATAAALAVALLDRRRRPDGPCLTSPAGTPGP